MTGLLAGRILAKLGTLTPFSPGFLAFRDDFEHVGASDSARLSKAVAAVAHCAHYLEELAQAWRRAERWTSKLEQHLIIAGASPAVPEPKQGWRFLRPRPPQPPRPTSAQLLAETAQTISQLSAVRDLVLQQRIAIERIARELSQAQSGAEGVSNSLAHVSSALHDKVRSLADAPMAGAIMQEIIPATVRREQTLRLELALAMRASLEMTALQQGNATLADALDKAIAAARFAGKFATAVDQAARDLDAAARDPAAPLAGAPNEGQYDHPDRIDPTGLPGAAGSLSNLQEVLTGVGHAVDRLEATQVRLEAIPGAATRGPGD